LQQGVERNMAISNDPVRSFQRIAVTSIMRPYSGSSAINLVP
jgi:hypothetical protein